MAAVHLLDLSHTVTDGMETYPGLPGPAGTEFQIGRIDMVANTGTYLDTPAHRYADGWDLSALPLDRVALVPALVVDATGAIGPLSFANIDLADRAVLLRTGWDRHWGTAEYGAGGHPFLTEPGAGVLVDAGVTLVGIDSVNIDDTATGERPAHSALLAAGIPIVEHLTSLGALPKGEFTFTAVPVKVAGMGTFPVRAFAAWQ
jgi:kynurenine formamidase